MEPVKVAIVGAGFFGSRHASSYATLSSAKLLAVCDQDIARAREVSAPYGALAITELDQLPKEVEAVSIAAPTVAHFSIAKAMLDSGRHIMMEKPIAATVEEARTLEALAAARGLVFQVGHLERFNPAMQTAAKLIKEPRYIECHRISPFQARATDVNVVLDLMIHDIDLVLSLVQSPVTQIEALGTPMLTGEEDIAKAYLKFANGCTADLTASRLAHKKQRTLRVFHGANDYLVVDLQNCGLWVKRKEPKVDSSGVPHLDFDSHPETPGNNLARELESFVDCVRHGKAPLVTATAGREALAIAIEITEKMRRWRAAF